MRNRIVIPRPKSKDELERLMDYSGVISRAPAHYVITDTKGRMSFPRLLMVHHMRDFGLMPLLDINGVRAVDFLYDERAVRRGDLKVRGKNEFFTYDFGLRQKREGSNYQGRYRVRLELVDPETGFLVREDDKVQFRKVGYKETKKWLDEWDEKIRESRRIDLNNPPEYLFKPFDLSKVGIEDEEI